MTGKAKNKSDKIRKKADKKIRMSAPKAIHDVSAPAPPHRIQDLRVHQIELEMQNEELRNAQEIIEGSRSKYSDLYDFAPIGYFTFDENGLILEANLTGAEQLGLKRSALINKPFSRFIHKDDANAFNSHRREVMKSEKRRTCEIRLKRKDKTEFYAQLVSTAITDDNSRTWIRSALMNITDSKVAEHVLRDSETMYRNFVDNSLVGIFKTDITGKFLYVNDALARMFEFDSSASLTYSKAMTLYKSPEIRTDIIKILKSRGKISNYELEGITKNGNIINVIFNAAIEGDIISGMVMDITERKKAELEQLRLTQRLEAQWKLARMVDADQKQLYSLVLTETMSMTESPCGIYGLVDEDEGVMNIHTWSEELMRERPMRDKPIVLSCEESGVFGDAIGNRKTLIINDYPGKEPPGNKGLPEGHVSIQKIMVIPVFRKDRIVAMGAVANKTGNYTKQDAEQMGSFLQSAQLIHDKHIADKELTKHREHLMELVEERTSELQKINERLEREIAERKRIEAESIRASHLVALGELAAGVAHEINNPINGIINYAQILANKSQKGSRDRDVADRLIKEGDRIADIVKSLLSFARADNTVKICFHIKGILNDSLALTQAQIRSEGINLIVDIPESTPSIMGQPQQIEQVFLNIISNARYTLKEKYQEPDEKNILKITTEEVSVHNQPYIRISFYDSGQGIQASKLSKVMNPFFTTKPHGIGTGLGLSISHGIITDHNGRLSVESVEGEFTNVIIDLPVCC